MSKHDDEFIRNFTIVLGAIFVFFLLALFIARGIGASAFEKSRLTDGEVAKRIQPVGQVAYGKAGEMAAAPEPEVVASAAPKSADEIYQSACIACHSTGAAGAPKTGTAADWEPRLGQGLAALVGNAINGKGLMPAKGGNPALSDADVEVAVKFMLEKSGVSAN